MRGSVFFGGWGIDIPMHTLVLIYDTCTLYINIIDTFVYIFRLRTLFLKQFGQLFSPLGVESSKKVLIFMRSLSKIQNI